MDSSKVFYIAGVGTITALGANAPATSAAVSAGISAYRASDYYNKNFYPVTVAAIPDDLFATVEIEILNDGSFDDTYERVIKMAILSIQEACAQCPAKLPLPMVLAMPEVDTQLDHVTASALIKNLVKHCEPWISPNLSRSIHSGRASGMEALGFAFEYLYSTSDDFILVGGSDSYFYGNRLDSLEAEDRLLCQDNPDSFAPGEAAGFLLLTTHPEFALVSDDHIIALHPPGIADEAGHRYSEEHYLGDGLDQAFKQALIHYNKTKIQSIYCSMNGENYWTKEYGVAYLRNRSAFEDSIQLEHPAEYYGDIGAATVPVLIAQASDHLLKTSNARAHLVYSASDTERRGAIVLEKMVVKDSSRIREDYQVKAGVL
jgi:3-oxoacyl-[acyl-carrier-protein] synthase I